MCESRSRRRILINWVSGVGRVVQVSRKMSALERQVRAKGFVNP